MKKIGNNAAALQSVDVSKFKQQEVSQIEPFDPLATSKNEFEDWDNNATPEEEEEEAAGTIY